ncbi:homoserine O-acetyltransferase [Virgibacillus kekensis]|uniref:Homoserine O-acetyltransferase n=1 Tax=Virgibacillus kekensis TaxID=202261 RepID=A0ABV9DID3_9BACI
MLSINQTSQTGRAAVGPLKLESGIVLEDITLQYEMAGPSHAPVILVCHALTGNHQAIGTEEHPGWWSGLIGPEKYIDTEKYRVLTFNVLGGCDGSTGPASTNPQTDLPFRTSFPEITVRDMVHAQFQALDYLNITSIDTVIGGSLGGMQAMEWALLYPETVEKLIILASTPVFSSYGIAFNHIASSAIKNDPSWQGGNYTDNTVNGLAIARMVGMITYRSPQLLEERFGHNRSDVTSYLDYQGEKLINRFDPNSYLYLLQAMNGHDIGRNRDGWQNAANKLTQPALLLSFDKDLIYEPDKVHLFSRALPNSIYRHIETDFGHDGFLTEFPKWGGIVHDFLKEAD